MRYNGGRIYYILINHATECVKGFIFSVSIPFHGVDEGYLDFRPNLTKSSKLFLLLLLMISWCIVQVTYNIFILLSELQFAACTQLLFRSKPICKLKCRKFHRCLALVKGNCLFQLLVVNNIKH